MQNGRSSGCARLIDGRHFGLIAYSEGKSVEIRNAMTALFPGTRQKQEEKSHAHVGRFGCSAFLDSTYQPAARRGGERGNRFALDSFRFGDHLDRPAVLL